VNCWALVQQVYQDELGITVGDVGEQRTNMRTGEWFDVYGDTVREFDVLLFKSSAVNRHVGLVLCPSQQLMLHTIRGANSCIERWAHPQWRTRLVGIYRHRKRCSNN
jgi:cell wall-associated NlpC family hydrolase